MMLITMLKEIANFIVALIASPIAAIIATAFFIFFFVMVMIILIPCVFAVMLFTVYQFLMMDNFTFSNLIYRK